MPRRPVADQAMTAAERQRRRRARVRDAVASLSPERRFRRELLAFVETYRALHPYLSAGEVEQSLKALATAIGLDEFQQSEQGKALYRNKGWEADDPVGDFLRAEPSVLFFRPFSLGG